MRRNFGFSPEGVPSLGGDDLEKIDPKTRIVRVANDNREIKSQVFQVVRTFIQSIIRQ